MQNEMMLKMRKLKELMKPIEKTSKLYSALRLACVILAIALSIYAQEQQKPFGYVIALLSIVFFIVLVIKHSTIKKELRYKQANYEVYEHLLKRFDTGWKQEDNKQDVDEEDSVSIDLDILGHGSLFQYVNMAATPFGKDEVMMLLQGKKADKESILKRQAAIEELLENKELLLALQTSSHLFQGDCLKIKRETFSFLIAYGKEKSHVFSSGIYQATLFLACITVLGLLLTAFNLLPYSYVSILITLNIILSLVSFAKIGKALEFTKNLERILQDYQVLFQTFTRANVKDSYLLELQSQMTQGEAGIRALVNVLNIVLVRNNLLGYLLGAAIFLIDFRCIHALEKWRDTYGDHIEEWLYSAGTLEALCSLAVIGQVKETHSFAQIYEGDGLRYHIEGGFHPLIQEYQAVANSIKMKSDSIIITGSNMSGKTTFLRTLGMNMMLLLAGAPVCAKHMEASLLQVYTSMRVKDDVNEGISTFYAELLRIRHMMEDAKLQRPMLVLVDEIFKGTNSADRVLCAKTAIQKLHLPWVMMLVSTHDFELCELEHDKEIQGINYHFSEYYIKDDIHFDYTLKLGRCTTTNAQQLMKLAGF